jgi:KDO2-lipid IV(A) lauroyltransferase
MVDGRRRIKHAVERFGFFALAGVVRALPRRAALFVGTVTGRIAFDVVRIRRETAVRNVMERLAPPGGRTEAERVARESYAVMGRTFCDLLRIDRMGDDLLWRVLAREDFAWTREVRDARRGGLLVSGHFGNWELLCLAIRRSGVPVHAMAADQANPSVNDYLMRTRGRAGIRALSARRGLREAIAALEANEFVATLMDQDARHKGVFLDFLGAPTATHTGVVAMAVRTGSPLVPGVLIDEGGTYRFVRGNSWQPNPAVPEEENLRDGAEHFNRFLEEQVRLHPENYFWAHRRWKTRPPGEAPA